MLQSPRRRASARKAIFVLAGLCLSALASLPVAAAVFMQLAEDPNLDTRFVFLGSLNEQGSQPLMAESSGTNGAVSDYAHGRVDFDGVGLLARQTSFNSLDRGFTVSALLRYSDLAFTSDDGANSVTGTLQLALDGVSEITSTRPGSGDLGLAVEIFARSNSSSTSGRYSRRLWIFGDNVSSIGLLTGYGGSGPFSFEAPLTFSTVNPEKIEIELRLTARTFTASPIGVTGTVAMSYFDTLALNPDQLVNFTSGLNPTFSATSGEIVDNQLLVAAVPLPAALWLLAPALVGLSCARRRA